MRGLVLEGGGAKGSFHAGALKALFERGYTFQGVTGTSIGALNGAMVAQGDFEVLYEIWENATPSMLIDVDDAQLEKVLKGEIDRHSVKYLLKTAKAFIANRGVPMDKAQAIVDKYIDEERLRASKTDFGLVTVSITDDWSPMELFKEEIPVGMLKKYILASAYFPVFRRPTIEGKAFMDGGMYDNCPINPLIYRGYDEIIAIRTASKMPRQKVIDESVKVSYIDPSESLGKVLDFRNEHVRYNIKLGYFDATRFIDGLIGTRYYIKPISFAQFVNYVEGFGVEVFKEWSEILGVKGNKRELLAAATMVANKELSLTPLADMKSSVIAMLEYVAAQCEMEKFEIYSLNQFVTTLAEVYRGVNGAEDDTKSYALVRALIKNLAR